MRRAFPAGCRARAWLRGWSAPASLIALAVGIVLSCLIARRTDWLSIGLEVGSNAVLPWLVGRYATARRTYIDELRHRRGVELRDAAAEVDKAVAKERTSIARDLHDVISHHVSAIGVHAGRPIRAMRSLDFTFMPRGRHRRQVRIADHGRARHPERRPGHPAGPAPAQAGRLGS